MAVKLKNARRPVSRVLFPPEGVRWPFIWDARRRTPRATYPGGGSKARMPGPKSRRAAPIRSCSRWGLHCRFRCRSRGALLPHHFTLTRHCRSADRRYVFCCTFPRVAPAGRYPAPCFRGARTFLPPMRSPAPKGDHPAVWRVFHKELTDLVNQREQTGQSPCAFRIGNPVNLGGPKTTLESGRRRVEVGGVIAKSGKLVREGVRVRIAFLRP